MTAQCDRCMHVKSTVMTARTDDDMLRLLCMDCREDLKAHVEIVETPQKLEPRRASS